MSRHGHKDLVRSLEKAVTTAFSTARIKPEDLTQGPILFTDLAWQSPPIMNTVEKLNGTYLYEYFLCDLTLDLDQLYHFWVTKLSQLYHRCHEAVEPEHDCLSGVQKQFKSLPPGQQRFRFSIPEGYPDKIDSYAGAIFSLEVAHLASLAFPLELIRNENNYYVTLADGRTMGIKNGLPCVSSDWDTSIAGAVWEFLEMPRGRVSRACLYDPLAKLRSTLHEKREDFRTNFQGTDYALQALRKLCDLGSPCRILTASVSAPPPAKVYTHAITCLKSALATMERTDITDRSRLSIMYSQLVPSVMSEGRFRSKVFNLDKAIPFCLSVGVTRRIASFLQEELAKFPTT